MGVWLRQHTLVHVMGFQDFRQKKSIVWIDVYEFVSEDAVTNSAYLFEVIDRLPGRRDDLNWL